jgi:hypothetical protein
MVEWAFIIHATAWLRAVGSMRMVKNTSKTSATAPKLTLPIINERFPLYVKSEPSSYQVFFIRLATHINPKLDDVLPFLPVSQYG